MSPKVKTKGVVVEDPAQDESDEDSEDEAEAREKLDGKVDDAVDSAVKKGASRGKAVNIIGDIEEPEDPKDADEVKSYLKQINEKLDQLLNSSKKDEPAPDLEESDDEDEEEQKVAWYDREII